MKCMHQLQFCRIYRKNKHTLTHIKYIPNKTETKSNTNITMTLDFTFADFQVDRKAH